MKIQVSISGKGPVYYNGGRTRKFDMGDMGPTYVARPVRSTGIFWLNVPFEQKEAAKAKGAKWDREKKQWYVPEGTYDPYKNFGEWMPSKRDDHGNLLLDVPFEQKDIAKELGAKWNSTLKRWYVPHSITDIEPFRRWF